MKKSHKSRLKASRKIIMAAGKLEPSSIEFYDVVSRYYRKRHRVMRSCGLFFLFMAVFMCSLIYFAWGHWMEDLKMAAGIVFSGFIGGSAFENGDAAIRVIKGARNAGNRGRLEMLKLWTQNPMFQGDEVTLWLKERLEERERT